MSSVDTALCIDVCRNTDQFTRRAHNGAIVRPSANSTGTGIYLIGTPFLYVNLDQYTRKLLTSEKRLDVHTVGVSIHSTSSNVPTHTVRCTDLPYMNCMTSSLTNWYDSMDG